MTTASATPTRCGDAGVPVRLTNYLKVPHGFAFMPGAAPAVGRQQRWELASELTAALGAPRLRG